MWDLRGDFGTVQIGCIGVKTGLIMFGTMCRSARVCKHCLVGLESHRFEIAPAQHKKLHVAG